MNQKEIDFRSDPKKVSLARNLLESPIIKEMLDVAFSSMADDSMAIEVDINPTHASIMLGITRGERRYHNLFKRLGTHLVNNGRGPDPSIPTLEPE